MLVSRDDKIRWASDEFRAGRINEDMYRIACECAIYGMPFAQYQLRDEAIDRLLADEKAEDRAEAIAIVNERGWFPPTQWPDDVRVAGDDPDWDSHVAWQAWKADVEREEQG